MLADKTSHTSHQPNSNRSNNRQHEVTNNCPKNFPHAHLFVASQFVEYSAYVNLKGTHNFEEDDSYCIIDHPFSEDDGEEFGELR
jgi:hypothetical protein